MKQVLFILLIALIFWGIIWGIVCSWLASQKNRNTDNWLILGFLFGLFAFIVLAVAPTKRRRSSPEVPLRIKRETLFANAYDPLIYALLGFAVLFLLIGVLNH